MARAGGPASVFVPQFGHSKPVVSVGFSPDGKWAMSADVFGTAILWDVATGRQLRSVRHSSAGDTYGSLSCAAFSPTGNVFATGGDRSSVILWHAHTGTAVQVLRKPRDDGNVRKSRQAREEEAEAAFEQVTSLGFSSDGRHLLAGFSDNSAWLWDVETCKSRRVLLRDKRNIRCVAISHDGTLVAAAGSDDIAIVSDVSTGRPRIELKGLKEEDVSAIAFSPDGKYLLGGDKDGGLILWDIATGKTARTFVGHRDEIRSLAFSPDGARFVSGSEDNKAIVWDVATGMPLQKLKGHDTDVTSVAFSPDGTSVLTGGADAQVMLWNAATGDRVRTFHGVSVPTTCVVANRDGRWLLMGTEGAGAVLWDPAHGKQVRQFRHEADSDSAQSVAISPDNKFVLTGDRGSGEARLWELETGKNVVGFAATSGYKTSYVASVAFTADGKYLFTAGGIGSTTLHDRVTGNPVRQFVGHSGGVLAGAVSPDRRFVLTGASDFHDRFAILWDAATAEEIRVLDGHQSAVTSVAFSPDGTLMATGSEDDTARLWETGTGKPLGMVAGHTAKISSIAFSLDGRFIITGSHDNSAIIWDTASRVRLRSLDGHTGPVDSAVFGGDTRFAFTASADGTVGMWDAATGRPLARLVNLDEGREWLVYTPDGMFDSSDAGTRFAAHRVSGTNTLLSDKQVQSEFRRPGMLGELFKRGMSNGVEASK